MEERNTNFYTNDGLIMQGEQSAHFGGRGAD